LGVKKKASEGEGDQWGDFAREKWTSLYGDEASFQRIGHLGRRRLIGTGEKKVGATEKS